LSFDHEIIIKRVKEIREQMPRIGTRKLYYLLGQTLEQHDISIGRDKLFDLLAEHGLLVRRRKRKRVSTTDSRHRFRRYPNIIRDLVVDHPNYLWVSDITYISLKEGFCYLSLVTDAYSRKIVGYCLYPSLKKEGPVHALRMALDSIGGKAAAMLIHHSDRGLQYCCGEYTTLLEEASVLISMTEKGDPYENAIAERVNGILKCEFGLDKDFDSYEQAREVVATKIDTYNQARPHLSCDNLTPDEAHKRTGLLTSRWKRKRRLAMV
jgi:transposase InsO family protein